LKECDKPNSHISSKLHVIYISSNNDRHTVTKTFTTLHSTSVHLWTLLYVTETSYIVTAIKLPLTHFCK